MLESSHHIVVTALLSGLLSACSLNATVTPDVDILPPVDNDGLISFDLYAENNTLHSLVATRDNRDQVHIAYRQSFDNGRTWSSYSDLSHLLDGKLESKLGNDIQLAAYGDQLMIVWQVEGELPGMGPFKIHSSPDHGKSWSVGSNPLPNAVDQSHPDMAADAKGLFHLVWLDDRDENGYQGIRYAGTRDLGNHWQTQTIDDSSCSCCWNRLLVTGDGRLNALYRDMEPRDMGLAQSGDAGTTWYRASTVGAFNWHFDGCPHNGGAVTATDPTHLHSLVWTGVDQKAGLYHLKSSDGGRNWSEPQPIRSEHPGFHGDLAALSDNRLMAIWDTRGASSEVLYSISEDGGNSWTKPSTLSSEHIPASMPRLVSGPAGWLAMWVEQPPGKAKHLRSALIK